MRLPLALVATAALALAAPAAASAAATLAVSPEKRCYGTGEELRFNGTGFTPGGIVDFTRDGRLIDSTEDIEAGPAGEVAAELEVANARGSETRTYAAIDRNDKALNASVTLRISELNVDIEPSGGQPSRPRTIAAVGFTTGRTLYAHILHDGRVRNLRVGRLRGACRRLEAKKRLFGPRVPSGRHIVRFDTERRYRKTAPAQRYSWRFRILNRRAG